MIESIFSLKKHQTSVRQEVVGGTTTFLTMAYIIFINPSILGDTGMDKDAIFTVTCVAAFIGTLLAAFWAKVPFAMAPGMGLNAFFTYTLVLGQGVSWQTALGIVFLSGVCFLILTLLGLREKIVDAIPLSLRLATSAGIGLFISFIGFKNMGLVVAHPATLVGIGEFDWPLFLGFVGLLITVVFEVKKVRGGILLGIIISTILGIVMGIVTLPSQLVSMPPSMAPIAFQLDIAGAFNIAFLGAIFSFMFVDLFDSLGTVVACAMEAKMTDEKGRIPRLGKILEADSLASIIGAVLGTSTTTTYVESASGIAQGARTGLASVITALLFIIALFFAPIIGIVPEWATAPALVIVGIYMFRNIKHINFNDLVEGVPAFLTIILMPLTYSISVGLSFGFVVYVVLAVLTGTPSRVSVVMWFIGVLSLINLIVGS